MSSRFSLTRAEGLIQIPIMVFDQIIGKSLQMVYDIFEEFNILKSPYNLREQYNKLKN